MRPLFRARMDERRGIIAAEKNLKPEGRKLLGNRRVLQLDVVGQTVLVWRRRPALDQRRNVSAAFRRDVKPVFGDEIARHHLFLVGDVGEIRNADAPPIRLFSHPPPDWDSPPSPPPGGLLPGRALPRRHRACRIVPRPPWTRYGARNAAGSLRAPSDTCISGGPLRA